MDETDRPPTVGGEHEEAESALEGAQTLSVGSVGEIDFRFSPGAVELVEVRPGEAWTHEVDEEDEDEIEIEFRREGDDGEVEVEVELEPIEAGLEIEVEFGAVTPEGRQTIGIASVGEIRVDVSRGALNLAAVAPAPGWEHTVDEEDEPEEGEAEVEVDFRHEDGTRVLVEIEVDAQD